MRILFFIDKLETGGKERRMLELIKELSKDSSYQMMIVLMHEYIGYNALFQYNIKVTYLIRKTTKDVSIYGKFYRLAKEFKPDIIHSWSSMTSIYALPTILLQRIKFYNNAINDAPPKVPFFSKEGFRSSITYPLSTKIFANSLAGIVSYHPPRSKTICIYNGFDLSRIENLTPEEEVKNRFKISSAFVVGMVGSFTSFKDYDSYIKAAQLILSKRRDVTFLAIGDGPTLKTMQESVSADNKSHILFLGNQSNVESIINIFNIGVLSTYSEGISNSIMEYMALSKPAVSVDEGGTRELIMDGVTGFLVPPKSPELLAQKIETLLNDTRLMQEMGARGRERIIDKFSLREMVTAYIDQYCQ